MTNTKIIIANTQKSMRCNPFAKKILLKESTDVDAAYLVKYFSTASFRIVEI